MSGELTNFVVWLHEGGFSVSMGFESGFGYDMLRDAINSLGENNAWNNFEVLYSQWVGAAADVEFIAGDGDEMYFGTPKFDLYGGIGIYEIVNEEIIPANIKALYIIVPLLDYIAAAWNLNTWEDTSDPWMLVMIGQASIGTMALIMYGLVWAVYQFGDLGDKMLAIYTLFHTLFEIAMIPLIYWADTQDWSPHNTDSRDFSYLVCGINIFFGIVINSLTVIGFDLDDLSKGTWRRPWSAAL